MENTENARENYKTKEEIRAKLEKQDRAGKLNVTIIPYYFGNRLEGEENEDRPLEKVTMSEMKGITGDDRKELMEGATAALKKIIS